LIDRKRHQSVLDVQLFGVANCDTDQDLVGTEVKGRLAMSKQMIHRFHLDGFNLKKLKMIEGEEQYGVEL
jgi:hypothetical protein